MAWIKECDMTVNVTKEAKNYPHSLFFALAYAFSWSVGISLALKARGLSDAP